MASELLDVAKDLLAVVESITGGPPSLMMPNLVRRAALVTRARYVIARAEVYEADPHGLNEK